MTHEREHDDEPTGGPAVDERLPRAVEIPVTEGPGDPDEDVADDDLAVLPGKRGKPATAGQPRPDRDWGTRERNRG